MKLIPGGADRWIRRRPRGTGDAGPGDCELSQAEEQVLVTNRSNPVFDQQPVPGTSVADLRPNLLMAYLASCRTPSTALAAISDDEILIGVA